MKSNRKLIPALTIAFICAVLFKTLVIEGFVVSGDSMSPTIEAGEYVFISKIAFFSSEPKRGDIVVAKPRDLGHRIIKRVIGLPRERVKISNNKIVIKQNRIDEGVIVSENYISNNQESAQIASEFQLDPHEYFLMGDNRAVSIDSRELGNVDLWDVKGKAFMSFSLKKLKFSLIR